MVFVNALLLVVGESAKRRARTVQCVFGREEVRADDTILARRLATINTGGSASYRYVSKTQSH
jgi:hypothetical protein